MTYATISSKGQITLPVKFLRGLGLKPKDLKEIKAAMMKGVAAHVMGRKA